MDSEMNKLIRNHVEEETSIIEQAKIRSMRTLERKKALSALNIKDFRKDFFPEFKFEEPLGTWTPTIGEVTPLFPFYKQIIVTIGPGTREGELGLSIPELVELYKSGITLPLLTAHPRYYTSETFKPLFELRDMYHVPTTIRVTEVFSYLQGLDRGKLDESEKQTKKQLTSKYGGPDEIFPKLRENDPIWFDSYRQSLGFDERTYRAFLYKQFVNFIQVLRIFGYVEWAERILSEVEDVADAWWILMWLYRLVSDPFLLGLGGYMNYEQAEIKLQKQRIILPDEFHKKAIALPQDLLWELADAYFCEVPLRMEDPLRFADKLRREDCTKETFKILKTLANDLNKGRFRDAFCREAKNAKEVIREIDAKVKEIGKGYERTKYGVTIGGIILASSPGFVTQALAPAQTASLFGWLGAVAANIFRAVYDEKLARFLTGLRFGRNTTSYLIWQHKKR